MVQWHSASSFQRPSEDEGQPDLRRRGFWCRCAFVALEALLRWLVFVRTLFNWEPGERDGC